MRFPDNVAKYSAQFSKLADATPSNGALAPFLNASYAWNIYAEKFELSIELSISIGAIRAKSRDAVPIEVGRVNICPASRRVGVREIIRTIVSRRVKSILMISIVQPSDDSSC